MDLKAKNAGVLQGHGSTMQVEKWFTDLHSHVISRCQFHPSSTFPTLTPQLAANYAANLRALLFTVDVPPRVPGNGPLGQSLVEYEASVDLFNQARRRYIVPLAALVLYDFVDPQKRADVAQALTDNRAATGVQAEGDVADYLALKGVLSSAQFTLVASLQEAVWKRGVQRSLVNLEGHAGATRAVTLAMHQEQSDLYTYATAEHGNVLPGGAADDDAPAFSANDVRRMCARVVLGHHLDKTISPRVLEAFRQHNIFLVPQAQLGAIPTVVLSVPPQPLDKNNIVKGQDVAIKRAWDRTFKDRPTDTNQKRRAQQITAQASAATTTAKRNRKAAAKALAASVAAVAAQQQQQQQQQQQ